MMDSRHGLVAKWIELYIIKILELMITLESFTYLADDIDMVLELV